jgi:hypothetical protein
MKHIFPIVLLGAATILAAQAWGQTQTKPPKQPASAAKPADFSSLGPPAGGCCGGGGCGHQH